MHHPLPRARLLALLVAASLSGCGSSEESSSPADQPSSAATSTRAAATRSPAVAAAAPTPPPPPAPAAPPMRGMRSSMGFLRCESPHSCQLLLDSTFGYVTVYELEPGAQVSAGGGRPFVAPARMRDRGRALPAWQSLLDTFELNDFADLPGRPAPPVPPARSGYLPITVTYADGTTAEGYFSVSPGLLPAAGEQVFQQVLEGPVPWPREGTGSSIVALIPGRKPRVFGPATQWGDLGRIALVGDRRVRTRNCGMYSSGSARTRVEARATDETWRVFDRRTGARLTEREFTAEMPACPTGTTSNTLEAQPSRDEIIAWLESLAAG